MPSSNNDNGRSIRDGHSIEAKDMAMVGAISSYPQHFFQQIPDIPTDVQTSAKELRLRLTDAAIPKVIPRTAIVANHSLNPPLVDMMVYDSRVFRTLREQAFNYQRQHQDAFFEQYPEAVLKAKSESVDFGTDSLRRNFEVYVSDLAHYFGHYYYAKTMQIAALANLNALTRLNGNGILKRIASDVRWTYINPRTNMYERSPSPKGMQQTIYSNTFYAIGKTNFNADIVSFPLWRSDIWGNNTQRVPSLDSLVVASTDGIGNFVTTLDKKYFESNDGRDAGKLLQNMTDVIVRYGAKSANEEHSWLSNSHCPNMTPIENGSRIVACSPDSSNDTTSAYAPGNLGSCSNILADYSPAPSTILTSDLWNSYKFWDEYLMHFFPEMFDPGSSIYRIAESLNLFEKSMKVEDINKMIRAVPNVDIDSLSEQMRYKADNRPTTATIVRWAPIIWDSDSETYGTLPQTVNQPWDQYSAAVFDKNFRRFTFARDPDDPHPDAREIILSAKRWPHLNPTMFYVDDELQPLVLNCQSKPGYEQMIEFVAGSDRTGTQLTHKGFATHSLFGRDAVMFDYAMRCAMDLSTSELVTQGVDQQFANKFAKDAENMYEALVFEECPDTLWVTQQPIIDNTDPSQCGFNLLVADGDLLNVWTQWIRDPSNYEQNSDSLKANSRIVDPETVSTGTLSSGLAPLAPVYGNTVTGTIATTGYTTRKHVVNDEYISLVKTALVFLGDSIFEHPAYLLAKKKAGFWSSLWWTGNYGEAGEGKSVVPSERTDTFTAINMNTFFDKIFRGATGDDEFWEAFFTMFECQSAYGARVVDDNKSNDPFLAVSGIVNQWVQAQTWVMQSLFAAEFGPVSIFAVYDDPLAGLLPVTPRFNDGNPDSTYGKEVPSFYYPNVAAMYAKFPRYDMTATKGTTTLYNAETTVMQSIQRRQFTFNNFTTHLKAMYFFLKRLAFSYVHVRNYRLASTEHTIYGGQQVCPQMILYFADQSDWLYTLMGETKTMNFGLKDTRPFWDEIQPEQSIPSIEKGPEFAYNDLVQAPRVLNSTRRADASAGERRNGSKNYSSEFTSSKSDRDNHGNHSAEYDDHSPQRDKLPSKRSGKKGSAKSGKVRRVAETSTEKIDDPVSGDKGSRPDFENSFMDASDAKTDKTAKKLQQAGPASKEVDNILSTLG